MLLADDAIYLRAADSAATSLQSHDGYEWFYVLNGHVRLILGDQEYRLGPGEAAEFDTRTPHRIGSAGAQPAELLTLFGPQGERAHLSPAPASPTGTSRAARSGGGAFLAAGEIPGPMR